MNMSKSMIAKWIAAAVVVLSVPALARAQAVANAQIHGVVTDSSGAVVPAAQVRAIQTETGQIQSTVTGPDGTYVLPNLPVGPYRLEVSAAAFSNYTQSGILLLVGNNVQINVALQVGAVTQEVQVAANAAMVETQDTSISEVIDQRRIIDLPLNGRQATDLILLSGGAAMPPNSTRVITTHDYTNAVGVSVAGGQINGNNYLLDGGDHNDTHSNVNMPFPFPDALQEFSVQTNGVSARYGLHPGSVVNVVTKTGTNQFHGGLFEFVRNGDFNAINFFARAQDSLRRNQFGGTIGGPIKKDKIFIFSGYQGTRERTAPPNSIAFVPTPAVLRGDFSVLESAPCQSNGRAKTLLDPTNGQPFPNNFISPSRFSPPSVALLKVIPTSNDPCGRLVYSIPNPNNENQYIGRADWLQSSRHSVFGRYFVADYDNPPYYQGNILTTTRSGLEERAQASVIGDTYNISPTLINAFHMTYSRLAINRAVSPQMPSPVGVGVNMFNVYPHYTDLSVSGYFSMGGGSNAPAYFIRNQWQWADDMDWIQGRHHLSFGMEAIAIQMNEINIQSANGTFGFNGSISNDALADFLLGKPNSLTQSNTAQIGLREKYAGIYFQDDIKMSPRLNVHAGLRWEPSLPEHDVAGRGDHFSLPDYLAGRKTSVYTNAPIGLLFYGDPGIPRAYADGSWLGFAPRIGFAWDPTGSGKQSIRSSYGIFFDTPESYTARDWALDSPWGNAVRLTAPAGGFADPYAGFPGGNPFPTPYPPTKDAPFAPQGAYILFPLNLHHPYMQQWDLSVQRQIGANWLVTAAYLGNKATHFRTSTEANPAIYGPGATLANTNQRRFLSLLNPAAGAGYSTITVMDDGLNTYYNALRLSAQHRFSRNFTILAVYTYSHVIQDAEPIANRLTGNNYANPYNRDADKSPADFDLRHNFTTSFVYESPKFANKGMNWALGNWQFSCLVSAHNGFPFSVTTGVDASLSGVGLDRPDQILAQAYVKNMGSMQWINPAAFRQNAPGTFGVVGYNAFLAPGFFDADANLTRLFTIRERHRFELRFEFFNVLNHPNFNAPVTRFASNSFGQIQSAGSPRILQFAAKYSF